MSRQEKRLVQQIRNHREQAKYYAGFAKTSAIWTVGLGAGSFCIQAAKNPIIENGLVSSGWAMDVLSIVSVVLPVFAIIALGYTLASLGGWYYHHRNTNNKLQEWQVLQGTKPA